MGTFAEKENQPQKAVSPRPTPSNTATPRLNHRADLILQLERTIGNQAVVRMLQANAEELEAGEPASVVHHSPPATGPGSRGEPLKHGHGSVQSASTMKTDAYFRSPVNRANPVLVWTNGTALFFAPSEGQETSGRMAGAPESSFSPPSGYTVEELRWDQDKLTTGGAPLVVVARKAGAPDLQVRVWDTLEQTADFSGMGLTGNAQVHVSRAGTEFVLVDESKVPLEFSGATTQGAIHGESFAEGYFRYRAPGGDHDLYVAKGADPVAHLVERVSGKIVQTFAAGTIAAVVPEETGVISLELATTKRGSTTQTTKRIDLRTSPPTISTASGHATAEAGYADAKRRLEALGIHFEEVGLRLSVRELEAIEQALTLGSGRGLDALVEFRTLFSGGGGPILEVSKSLGVESAGGLAEVTSGTPLLFIREPFVERPTERAATVRHEMTHIIMGAIDAVSRSKLTTRKRADLEGALRFEAARAHTRAEGGLLRAGEYGAGDVRPPAGSQRDWRALVGKDVELAETWVELLPRYSFIPDPEGAHALRGASLADESRYAGTKEQTGHPTDSADEFVASFVTCATLFQPQFVAAVLEAETAGNARGGGGSYLRGLFRRAWKLIDARYVPLGANPF